MPDFERLKRLGAGNFGEVWLVYDKALDVQRAVKFVEPSRVHNPTDYYHEPKALMELRHDNVVRVEDAGTLENGILYISMEYLRRGSVEAQSSGRPIALSKAVKWLTDICWALEYAHNREYVHRDIKPANILIGSKGEAKLSDFGLAVRVPRGQTASPYGYLTHVAPETLSDGITSKYTDIYALGVTAYRLINGDGFLQQYADLGELQDDILTGDYPDRKHYRPYVPLKLQRLVNKAMAVDPDQRHKNASYFRRELEKIDYKCDWKWRQKKKKITYTAVIGSCKMTVELHELANRKFSITTSKQVNKGVMRKVTKDCYSDLTLAKMKTQIRAILRRYVESGK